MVMFRQRWGWRTLSCIAALTILAGLAGVGSELMAGASVTQFSLKGAQVFAEWDAIPTGTFMSSGWVESIEAVTGPGKPTPAPSTSVFADSWDTTSGFEITMWAEGPLGPTDVVSVDPNLASGNTSVSIPGTLDIWDWNAGTVDSVAATAFVNASVENTGTTFNELTMLRQFDKNTGTDIRTMLNARTALAEGSGGETIVDAGGTTYTIVAPGTATSFAELRNIREGNRKVSH